MTQAVLTASVAGTSGLNPESVARVFCYTNVLAVHLLQHVGKFEIPVLVTVETSTKGAKPEHQKMVFGAMKTIRAKPATTVLKASTAMVLKDRLGQWC